MRIIAMATLAALIVSPAVARERITDGLGRPQGYVREDSSGRKHVTDSLGRPRETRERRGDQTIVRDPQNRVTERRRGRD